jgi:hypothetical protein
MYGHCKLSTTLLPAHKSILAAIKCPCLLTLHIFAFDLPMDDLMAHAVKGKTIDCLQWLQVNFITVEQISAFKGEIRKHSLLFTPERHKKVDLYL